MKRLLPLSALLLSLLPLSSEGRVVRPAPDFAIAGGKTTRSLRGQALVILVAPSPNSKEFRRQVRRLEADYNRFAAQDAIFIAAFTAAPSGSNSPSSQGGRHERIRSNIPFAIAANGAEVAARYGITTPFALLVVGKDGNLDLRTRKVTGAYAVRDALLNNYERQAATRRVER